MAFARRLGAASVCGALASAGWGSLGVGGECRRRPPGAGEPGRGGRRADARVRRGVGAAARVPRPAERGGRLTVVRIADAHSLAARSRAPAAPGDRGAAAARRVLAAVAGRAGPPPRRRGERTALVVAGGHGERDRDQRERSSKDTVSHGPENLAQPRRPRTIQRPARLRDPPFPGLCSLLVLRLRSPAASARSFAPPGAPRGMRREAQRRGRPREGGLGRAPSRRRRGRASALTAFAECDPAGAQQTRRRSQLTASCVVGADGGAAPRRLASSGSRSPDGDWDAFLESCMAAAGSIVSLPCPAAARVGTCSFPATCTTQTVAAYYSPDRTRRRPAQLCLADAGSWTTPVERLVTPLA